MITHHSHIGTAAWSDLLRLLKDVPDAEFQGTPKLKMKGRRGYWYDQYRIGTRVIDRYIGEDSDTLRERLDRARDISARRKSIERERSRLIRVLRAEGYLMSDAQSGQAVSAMARVGVFRHCGILLGTHAFRLYEGDLGLRIKASNSSVVDEIDTASSDWLSIALPYAAEDLLSTAFSRLKFAAVPSRNAEALWRWQQTDRRTLVKFFTNSFAEDGGVRDLPALGISAQQLDHLNFLMAEPIQTPFLYRSGSLVQVPRPERFAIHRLISADRHQRVANELQAHRDRAQAELLIEVLGEERPHELADAYETAMRFGPSVQSSLLASLKMIPWAQKMLDGIV